LSQWLQRCLLSLYKCFVHFIKKLTEIPLVSVYRYATYVEVPDAKFAVKVPDSIPLEVACMLPCSGVTAYHAVSVIKPVVDNVTQNEGNHKAFVTLVYENQARNQRWTTGQLPPPEILKNIFGS